jgi:hypothetical protein
MTFLKKNRFLYFIDEVVSGQDQIYGLLRRSGVAIVADINPHVAHRSLDETNIGNQICFMNVIVCNLHIHNIKNRLLI